MSLFGDEADGFEARPTGGSRKTSNSLFDDEPTPASKSTSSLFADDGAAGDSPWDMPTPKKADRSEVVKKLLPDSVVPESYIDAFDAVLNDGERAGANVSSGGIQKLLQGSNISPAEQTRLWTIVTPGGNYSAGLGRSQFNVLLALIGLAQEGDDATLDSVDERRKSMTRHPLKVIGSNRSRSAATDSCLYRPAESWPR
jgi:sorting nexin-8